MDEPVQRAGEPGGQRRDLFRQRVRARASPAGERRRAGCRAGRGRG